MPAQFRLARRPDGRFYFTLASAGGEELLRSRTYAKICTAESAIEMVRDAVAFPDRVRIQENGDGRFCVAVQARTTAVVARGPNMASERAAAASLVSIRNAAPSAEVIDTRKR